MICPQCTREVADGTTICPYCDNILDSSFLSDEVDGAKPAKARPQPQQPPQPDPNAPKPWEEPYQIKKGQELPPPPDLEKMAKGVLGFYNSLELEDKISTAAMVAIFFFSIIPWATAPGVGDISGIEKGGWITILCAIGAAALFYLRNKGRSSATPLNLIYGQLGCGAVTALIGLFRIIHPGTVTTSKEYFVFKASAVEAHMTMGVFLVFLAGAALAAGSYLTMSKIKGR